MWLEFVYILFFLSLTRGSTTKTSPSNVPTVTVPIRTLPRCRSTCLHMPSKTPRRTAAACAAGRTPQWVQTPSTIFKIWTNCCSDVLKCCFSLVFFFPGDVPYKAHVETHNGGTYGFPSLSSAQDRVSHYPYTDLPHLSSPPLSSETFPVTSALLWWTLSPLTGSENVPDCTNILWRGALLMSMSSFHFLLTR